jgi:hypothetical protein
MNSSDIVSSRAGSYALFEHQIRAGFTSLTLQPDQIATRIKHMNLPTFDRPVEMFEVSANFPGATCLISFGESVVDADIFFTAVEFERFGQPTLFLKDYLASRKDPRQEFLRFRKSEHTLELGILSFVEMLTALLNNELRPLLEGRTWLIAPFDWGDYK